jgi:NADH dehydrogenase FAD-containing subunit
MYQIVIIGGGPAGVDASMTLSNLLSVRNDVQITLIEKRDRYFHSIGALRAMVDTSFTPKILIPYDDVFQGASNVELKFATVQSIDFDARSVCFSATSSSSSSSSSSNNNNDNHQETLHYDYLIMATGSSYPAPIKPANDNHQDITKEFSETAKNISQAERILVIGGGAVGVELAGELKAFYPEKKIMLLDANNELLSNQNVPKLRPAIKKALLKHGVELFLGHRLKDRFTNHQFGTKRLETDQGLVIESDAQLICVGMKPNIDLMTDPQCLKKGRFIKVKDTMEVDGPSEKYKNVFVLGDASNHPTPKLAYWAGEQGKHLAKGISEHILNDEPFKPFLVPPKEILIIPLGPNGGMTQLPFGKNGFIVGNFLTKMAKAKDLFASMTWKKFNAKMPKE